MHKTAFSFWRNFHKHLDICRSTELIYICQKRTCKVSKFAKNFMYTSIFTVLVNCLPPASTFKQWKQNKNLKEPRFGEYAGWGKNIWYSFRSLKKYQGTSTLCRMAECDFAARQKLLDICRKINFVHVKKEFSTNYTSVYKNCEQETRKHQMPHQKLRLTTVDSKYQRGKPLTRPTFCRWNFYVKVRLHLHANTN